MQASIRFGNVEVRPAERQVLRDGAPAHVSGRAFDVLLALIERRERVVSKDELFELVWPGLVVEENNLQVHISALRKLLGAQAIVTVAGRGYRFALSAGEDPAGAPRALPTGAVTYLFTDVEGSSRLWEEQPQAMAEAMSRHDALCRQLIAAHHGHFVKQTGDGVHAVFEHASDAVATAVALQLGLQDSGLGGLLRVRIGLNRGADELRAGDYYGPAVNRTARVMTAAHGEQVLLTQAVVDVLQGRLPDGATLRDLGNVRLRDLSGPEHVYQLLHPRLRNEFPALRSLEATPNNLPQQLNSFIGREREMAEVAELLAQHRLVTLLAMGGIGKSRLAVQLGAQLLDRFADGVWLVELAALTDPQSVPQALATVLGLRDEPGTSLIDTLINHLRERRLLILLDNCEHLVDACAEVAKTLLQRTAGVRILATSRDPLAIAGEMSVPLQPLSVPLAGEATVDQLMQHEAVRLFVERSRAAQPGFGLEAANAAAVAEICGRLDGIPLALELAAARVRVMTPQVIASRLDQRFKLLVAGDRTVLPRQKTLRALIDWSYDMLPEQERLLFARLSVFAGGWSLESAEQVCSDEALAAEDVLDLLGNLVQKSLVVLDADAGRYGMLETVRAFAREKLQEFGQLDQSLARFVGCFASLTDAARAHLLGAEQSEWLQRLDAERENLLAAVLHSAAADGEVATGLRMVSSLKFYCLNRGLLDLGLRLLQQLLDHPKAQARDLARCRGLSDAGQMSYFLGRYKQAREQLHQALVIARELGQAARVHTVLHSLIMVEAALGELIEAQRFADEALEIARSMGDPRPIAGTVNSRAQVLRMRGRLDEARTALEESISLFERSGDKEGRAIALLNLAMVMVASSDLEKSAELLCKVFAMNDGLQSRVVGLALVDTVSGWAAGRGDFAACARLHAVAERLAKSTGLHRDPADQEFVNVVVSTARKALGQHFSALEAGGEAGTFEAAMLLARSALGDAAASPS